MKPRVLVAALALAALLALVAGCGGSSSGSQVAELAPPGVPVFVEGTLRPTGELKSNADAIAERVAGIDNLGEYVVEKLESSARKDGQLVYVGGVGTEGRGERATGLLHRTGSVFQAG